MLLKVGHYTSRECVCVCGVCVCVCECVVVFAVQAAVPFLSLELRDSVALLLMNAYSTHVGSKQIQHIFTDGHTQVTFTVICFVLHHFPHKTFGL